MRVPESLPATLFLLALDADAGRLRHRDRLGYLLRAAALTDLTIRGHLADEGGKVQVVSPGGAKDGVLGMVLEQLAAAPKPRGWKHWVRRDAGKMIKTVRESLAAEGWIRVEPRRVLGLFPGHHIAVPDPELVRGLHAEARETLTGDTPVSQVEPARAAVIALACAGELKTVVTGAERRKYKARIAELNERAGAAAPALRKVLTEIRAAMTAAIASSTAGQGS